MGQIRRCFFALLATLSCTSCVFTAPPSSACPTLPPPAVALSTAPPAAPELLELHARASWHRSGTLASGPERVEFDWLRHDDGRARACVLLVPILAGSSDVMAGIAAMMFAHDFDVAYCARAGSAMAQGDRGPELQELLRRTVMHQRVLLQWLRQQPDAPTQTFVLGISMGGMVATILGAADPAIDGLAICLAGGDFSRLVLASAEPRVRRWVQWRKDEDGVGEDHLAWELKRHLQLEPLLLAPSVPTEKVLFVSARFDDVVPPRHQQLLWEALGRPARLHVPFGHYTAALAIDPILAAAAQHFRSRTRSTE